MGFPVYSEVVTVLAALTQPPSVLDPFDPEHHRPESVRAASEGDTLLFHPGIVSAIQNVDKVSLDIREGPVAEIRRAVVAVHNEFLAHTESLAFRCNLCSHRRLPAGSLRRDPSCSSF